jgi:hypothetical protein
MFWCLLLQAIAVGSYLLVITPHHALGNFQHS